MLLRFCSTPRSGQSGPLLGELADGTRGLFALAGCILWPRDGGLFVRQGVNRRMYKLGGAIGQPAFCHELHEFTRKSPGIIRAIRVIRGRLSASPQSLHTPAVDPRFQGRSRPGFAGSRLGQRSCAICPPTGDRPGTGGRRMADTQRLGRALLDRFCGRRRWRAEPRPAASGGTLAD